VVSSVITVFLFCSLSVAAAAAAALQVEGPEAGWTSPAEEVAAAWRSDPLPAAPGGLPAAPGGLPGDLMIRRAPWRSDDQEGSLEV